MKFDEKKELVRCLAGNLDIFAWSPSDIPKISPTIAQHHLSVLLGAKSVEYKKRNLAPERQVIVKAKVDKLQKVGFIPKVQYLEWLAHIVLVKKSNGKWYMCMDNTRLNKACPKDSYPLS